MQSTKPSPLAVEDGAGTARVLPRPREFATWLTRLWRVGRWGIFGGALVYCVLALLGTVTYHGTPTGDLLMRDAAAYYYLDTPYDWSDGPGAREFRYSPAFIWVVAPLRLLPWELFAALWFAAHVGVLLYLRIPWMLAFPGVIDDAVRGNINTFLALAVVLIVRRTAAPLWGMFLLTKVTPGVAIVWHLARREYREFAAAVAVTAAVVGTGYLVDPQLWSQWFASLVAGQETFPATVAQAVPLPLRIALAAGLSAFAATSGRAWLLPVAVIAAMPGIWPNAFALLVASVALYKGSRQSVLEPVAMAERELVPVRVAEGTPVVLNSRSSIRK
ncbi:MAG TPA: glycosyltransferase family 87 protein [Pleomorphomonadaceae bacterium]|nr:glycosyltransferase family 87 protein [Pleomorphomonadaceae bacterium]